MFENDIDIVYLFLSLWIAIVWAFGTKVITFIVFFSIIFVWFFLVEKFIGNLKIMRYVSDIDKELNVSEIEKNLNIKVVKYTCVDYDDYKLLKEYKIYYVEKN